MHRSKKIKLDKSVSYYNSDNNNTTKSSSSSSSFLFNLIWNNSYLKRLIRNELIQNNSNNNNNNNIRIIKVDLEYFSKSINIIESFSDGLNKTFSIDLVLKNHGEFGQFINHTHRNLIGGLEFEYGIDTSLSKERNRLMGNDDEDEDEDDLELTNYDWNLIPETIERLKCTLGLKSRVIGRLPDTVKSINIKRSEEDDEEDPNPNIDDLLLHLPCNLDTLILPHRFSTGLDKVCLPHSLKRFVCSTYSQVLESFVYPPNIANDFYKGCRVIINEIDEEMEWFKTHPWITDILFLGEMLPRTIPPHIKSIRILFRFDDSLCMFSEGLELLKLKDDHYLSPNCLPSTLKTLSIYDCQTLDNSTLHTTARFLETLKFNRYNRPLQPGVLTLHLKSLTMKDFNKDLQVGVLPASLEKLVLFRFNQILKPSVLPKGLKQLTMYSFNNIIEKHSLPPLLEHLVIPHYSGTFDMVGPLNKLSILKVNVLVNNNINPLLVNVRDITLQINEISNNTSLQDIHLERLVLECDSSKKLILHANFLPHSIEYLFLKNILIQSGATIPHKCRYLIQ